jgi:hypothetical protein
MAFHTRDRATLNQVNGAYQDPNVTFDPGGRLMQLVSDSISDNRHR